MQFCSIVLAMVALICTMTSASHFRGGIFMFRPKPGGPDGNIEISYHISWRRNAGSHLFCDSNTIANGTLLNGQGSLTCLEGCSGNLIISQLSYVCTDFSAEENWSFGERHFFFNFSTLSINAYKITIGFASCCWISPYSSWNLTTTLSLVKRNDTGKINSSPRAITAPVIRLQEGCNHTIRLAVSDPDGDTVRCRWANNNKSECASICNAFPGASLDPASCIITYSANDGTGFRAAAIMLEDFTTGSSQPLSSVGLQFLVLVINSTEQCSMSPTFIPPTLPQGSCVSVPPMATFTTQLIANGSGSAIRDIETISPLGTSKGVLQHMSGTTIYYVNITWTPRPSQYNQKHPFCYTAGNTAGQTSEQTCIQILASHLPPALVNGTNIPNNQTVLAANTTWRARFDRAIQRSSDGYITFHEYTTDEEVYRVNASSLLELSFGQATEIVIRPNYVFCEGQKFYIKLSKSVVKEESGCGLVNEPIGEKDFWVFETTQHQMITQCVTIAIVTYTHQPTPQYSSNSFQSTAMPQSSAMFSSSQFTASPSRFPHSTPDTATGDGAKITGFISLIMLLATTIIINN